MAVYANRSGRDVVRNVFYKHAREGDVVCAVSPFFSYDELLTEVAKRGCNVKLVVRLGPSTSPKALSAMLKDPRVQVRYFTTRTFHSKLYIFGDRLALLGSANLTSAGVQSNQEVCVSVTPEMDDFDELASVFLSYWNAAEVLTKERLSAYADLYNSSGQLNADAQLEAEVLKLFGEVKPANSIRVGGPKQKKDKVFLEGYRRTYQEFFSAFQAVAEAYRADGRRQHPEDVVPLRIEIDLFCSFIREKHTAGDDYLQQPIRDAAGIAATARSLFDQWFEERWPYLDNHIPGNYAAIVRGLGKASSIEKANDQELFDALDVCHSFHDRLRFYKGGHATMRKAFLADNDVEDVRRVLLYLLHGPGDFVERMGTCIFDADYKLAHVGRSVVQEVFGWVNGEDVPICNGRTVKALRYLGADIQTYS